MKVQPTGKTESKQQPKSARYNSRPLNDRGAAGNKQHIYSFLEQAPRVYPVPSPVLAVQGPKGTEDISLTEGARGDVESTRKSVEGLGWTMGTTL